MEQREARVLPHSLEAEKSVLGGMLISDTAAELICEALKPEDFYLPAHQDIFSAMLSLYNRGDAVDSVTLTNALEQSGRLEAVGGITYITELSLFVPSAANVAQYIRIVEDRSVMRQLIRAGTEIVKDAQGGERPVGDMLDDAERRIFNISMKKNEDTLVHIRETAMESYFRIGELMDLKGRLSGLTTGFTDLDRLTSGLQKSDLIIVAGRPSMGKTAFALNIAQNAALKGKANVCIFSLEMSREQLARRILCANAGVDMQKVNTGNTTQEELTLLANTLSDLVAANIYIDDTAGISVSELRSRCRRLKSKAGLDLVVIDYLQLMKTSGNSDNRATEISDVTRSLKILARELNVPIILLSQLSRGPESRTSNGHRPIMADLRESGAIEQDADIIILLYRPAVYAEPGSEQEHDNTAEIIVAKHRNGPTDTVYLTWQNQYTRFTDRSDREEP
ncbi:MAG: replicative DNA helicase [Clostridiales bacterium]|nr:replicative DNA helicase [Clostridiales bacterium]